MDKNIAVYLSKKYKIDISQIVREFWEMLILYEISISPIGKWLIFKGGTALRLSYNSPRFSEDLDFSLCQNKITVKQLEQLLKNILRKYPNISIDDFCEKYNTFLAELKIVDSVINYPFRIKIEISKRKIGTDSFEPKLIMSDTLPVKFVMNVSTIEQIYKDKELCIKTRSKPRDYFDLWYISQILKIPYNKSNRGNKTELTREMRKYLPKDFYKIIDLI